MKTRLTITLMALVGLLILVALVRGTRSEAADNLTNPHYKGGSTFNIAGAGPNVARCGPFPDNIELSFTGSGIDTEGGFNNAVFSACTNPATNTLFDLKAIDTYTGSGDQVFIEASGTGTFTLRVT